MFQNLYVSTICLYICISAEENMGSNTEHLRREQIQNHVPMTFTGKKQVQSQAHGPVLPCTWKLLYP